MKVPLPMEAAEVFSISERKQSMQKTKKCRKIFYCLLVIWVLWCLPMIIHIPVFRGKYVNIVCGIGITATIISILYVLYHIQDVWIEDRDEAIKRTNQYLFEKYFGDMQCTLGEVLPDEKDQNMIYTGRDINHLYQISGTLNNIKFIYRGIIIQKVEEYMEPKDKEHIRCYFKGNTLKWTDNMLNGKNDMIFYTDAMAGMIQTYPEKYGYEKIHTFPNQSKLYAKGTPYADAVKRLCEISDMAKNCFLNVSKKNTHVDMAVFVKDSDVEIFLYVPKVKEMDTMMGICFITDMIKNLY